MLRTVVCDDEALALDLMVAMLRDTGEVDIAAACRSAREAVDVINAGNIDLAVFDIEMPEFSGVDVISLLTVEPRPMVIFATAHPEYAVEAFGMDAIDYLLKPLHPERVAHAVGKARRLSRLLEDVPAGSGDLPPPQAEDRTLCIRDGAHYYFVSFEDIHWIEAAGDYSLVHTRDREYAARIPIRSLEADLPPDLFVRVHRSAIISVGQVREVHRLAKGESRIVLQNGAEVKASRSYRETVRQLTEKA